MGCMRKQLYRHSEPIPTSRDTLLAQPAVCGSGCEATIPAPDASQRRVMAATPTLPLKANLCTHLGAAGSSPFKGEAGRGMG